MNDLNTRLLTNDRTVLQELFEAHYPSVCGAIHRLVGDRGMTEDLAQQVFIRFWEKREKINITTSPGAYLHRMAINEALAFLRSKKNRSPEEITATTPMGSAPDVEQDVLQGELKEQILRAVNTLPPRCRAVFQLSRFEEMSYQEIADKLGISIKTVEHQIGKALRVMREQLKPYLNA